jgi:aconitate hydratase A / 2-methylisocitrate dehydratase
VGMGVLPLQFKPGEDRRTHDLSGREQFDVIGVTDNLRTRQEVTVRVHRADGSESSFQAIVRVDSPVEVDYLRHGGILNMVLRNMMSGRTS